jgi:pimeloyl-ACP methyl ester carboxylesterase
VVFASSLRSYHQTGRNVASPLDQRIEGSSPSSPAIPQPAPIRGDFEDRAEAAAWKKLPTWAVVATSDNAIPPDAERFMAQRAGAQPTEVDASHSIALSQPTAVAELIRAAVEATSAMPIAA